MMTHEGGYRPSAVVRSIGLSAATRPYRAYRDSGVNRLGRVPEHWEVRRLKHSLGVNVAVLPEDTEPDYEFRYIDIGSVGTGELVGDPKPLRFETAPSRARRVVGRGDTLVSTVRTYLKAVWHAEDDVRDLVASTGFAVLTPKPWILPKFVGYACQSEPFTNGVTAESVGVVYPAIAEARLASALRLCIPPLPEQRTIVRFLDRTDRRIQRYVRAKERLIELLEEQKQAIIHQAVTGQIDVRTGQPYPAYKDSGVEWLGEVPAHWEVPRVKQATQVMRGKFTHRPRNDPALYGGSYPFVQTGDVARAEKSIRAYSQTLNETGRAVSRVFPAGTLVMAIAANIGDVAVLDFDACFPDSVVGFVPRSEARRDYLYYLFMAMKPELVRDAPVNTQGNLNVDRLGSQRIPLPSCPEQDCIVQQIAATTGHLNSAIGRVRDLMSLLREYRTRLIADVVTGKLDVREAAASLPEVDPLTADDPSSNPDRLAQTQGRIANSAPHPHP